MGRWVLVVIAMVWSGWRATALDLHMLRDAREAAEGWLDGTVWPGERVVGFGDHRMLPRLAESWPWAHVVHRRRTSGDPDLVVVNPRELDDGEPIYRRFGTDEWPYERIARIERPLPFDPIRIDGAETTIEFVNPPIEVWRRRVAPEPAVEALLAEE